MNGETLLKRIVSAVVEVTLFVCFLVAIIVLLTGCAEMKEDYVAPYIVSIDPAIQQFTKEEIDAMVDDVTLVTRVPPDFVHVKPRELTTITVTFSSPPEYFEMYVGPDALHSYSLDGTTLQITVHCVLPYRTHISFWQFQRVYIEWKGGGQLIQLWCPLEDGK